MSALRELQLQVFDTLFRRGERPLPALRENGLAPARRLQIYRNNMVVSLSDALAAVYPVVVKLVGEDFFRHCARSFIPLHPSRAGHLQPFGREFADFLAQFEAAAGLPYLPDVARLEWAWHQVFHAAAAPPLDLARLAAVPEEAREALQFRLQPAARLIDSPFPVLAIWETNQDAYAGDATVDLDAGGQQVLVIQRALEVELYELGRAEHGLLAALAAGATLAGAAEAAFAIDAAFDFAAVFGRQLALGSLADLEPAD
ncbi:MAG: putative DNA-binding domain-containing protein [Rhodocyclaceae bacterium]|nr:putative DNA-binding domain-containing protein [Rhodocyclaceae bacterium]MBX3669818.1 putative DNA-binding domain-containing protein [Rhodocyclaceae bacterium]